PGVPSRTLPRHRPRRPAPDRIGAARGRLSVPRGFDRGRAPGGGPMTLPIAPPAAPGPAAPSNGDPLVMQPLPRPAYRPGRLARRPGVSRRTLERERAAGRFPRPDLAIGKAPLWTSDSIRAYLERGGK